MGKMHGIEAVEFVKESNPNAPSLLIKKDTAG